MIEQTVIHHHTFLQWLNHNWAVISLIWFPAFMCYLNAFAIFFKIMGATKLADWLAKLEIALTAFVAAVRSRNQNTTTPEVPNVPKAP